MENGTAQMKIDALIARFFSAFDNRGGRKPQIADVTDCLAEKATIVRRFAAGFDLYSPSEFAAPRIALLNGGTLSEFHEWEVSCATEIFSGIASRVSRYSKAGLMNGSNYSGSGTKCFHLVDLGSDWRITSLSWVDDQ